MQVHYFDADGFYTHSGELPTNPVTGKPFDHNPDVCTTDPLPQHDPETERARRVAGAWTVEKIPAPEPEPEPEPETLEQAKARKNAEINAARLLANRSSFTHSGKAFACDELSRSDIDGTNGYVLLNGDLPVGWPGGWKAVDNTYLPIADVSAWTAFYGAMFAAGNANFAKAQTLKARLEAAASVEEVNAINWE